MNRNHIGIILMALAVAMLCFSHPAAAYPDKPIRVVVPFGAGGGSDTFVRSIQAAIKENNLLGQPLVVLNVPGGGSAVGSRRVKDAKPDGYEILFNQIALLSNQASGRIDFGYKDFESIAATGKICAAIMVRDDSPYDTLKDLMRAAREKPNEVIYGCNMGGLNHVAGLVLQASAPGAKFRFVQIGGGAKNFASMKGGHTEVCAFTGAEIVNYGQQGLKPLAMLAPGRDPNHPDLPTARELGYDANLCTVQMWFAPKGTPGGAVNFLADLLEKAVKTKFMKKKFDQFKMTPTYMRGAKLRSYLDSEYAKLEKALPKAK